MMKQLEIKYMSVNDIKPYKNNPRINEKAIPYVMNSIKELNNYLNTNYLDHNEENNNFLKEHNSSPLTMFLLSLINAIIILNKYIYLCLKQP